MNGPEIYATVFALVPSNYDENTLWAGSDDGLVHLTRDHGKSWKNITFSPVKIIKYEEAVMYLKQNAPELMSENN